jgi:hypothetical protein
MKRRVLMTVVVALSLLVVLTPMVAATAQAEEVEGCGRLWARGAGYAKVHGDGVVDVSAHGVGTVAVKGSEVLRAQGWGRRWDLPDGTTVFAGWQGHIHIQGRDLGVRMVGGIIEFTAAGRGWVFLKGRGHYRVNGQPGNWTVEGIRLELVPQAQVE